MDDHRTPNRKGHCECADSGCPEHTGEGRCHARARFTLRRVDMDNIRVRFCAGCAADAAACGVFA